MDERVEGRNRFIALFLIGAAILSIGFFMRESIFVDRAAATVDDTVEVFVPSADGFEQRMNAVDEARAVTDLINSRQTFETPSRD